MLRWRIPRNGTAWIALCLATQPVAAINVQIDYKYDLPANGGTNFFGSGNPQGAAAGAQAKAALDAAASYYSTILTDSFSPIQTPLLFHSSVGDGVWTWQWTENFNNPTTNNVTVVTNATIAADQYVIYAGARSLSGSTAGFGGPGGLTWSSNPTGGFTQAEKDQGDATTAAFQNQVEKRGQVTGFSRWGGTITFDNDGSTSWFYNHLATPLGNVTDFYSIAIHELGHTLGFGASSDFTSLVSGSSFTGVNAKAKNNGVAVPLSPDLGHWANGTLSVVYGTSTSQEASMDPDLQNGTRKKLTELDAAALKDIGWSLGPGPAVNGDYNNNGMVDAGDYAAWRKRLNQSVTLPNDTTPGTVTSADYTVWRTNFGKLAPGVAATVLEIGGGVPEPASALLGLVWAAFACFNRSTRRR